MAQARDHLAIRVGGSQAGHSVIDEGGARWAFRHIPVAAVLDSEADLVIGPGSEIDPLVLQDEIRRCEEVGIWVRDRLVVDPMATVITPEHISTESTARLTERLGSTGKGVGAARADRIMRLATLVRDHDFGSPLRIEPTAPFVYEALREGRHVVIEGVQGYGLGLHTPYYPKTTSLDADATTFLALAGLSPWHSAIDSLRVLIVVRPFPIRVAGDSGPMLDETTWKDLGLAEERTTVTQKIRRVGQWDPSLVQAAVLANGGPSPSVSLAVSMLDHRFPTVFCRPPAAWPAEAHEWLAKIEAEAGARVRIVGTSPADWWDYA